MPGLRVGQRFRHTFEKIMHAEGLLQDPGFYRGALGSPRHEKDGKVRLSTVKTRFQFRSAHSRHDDVRKEHVDFTELLIKHPNCFFRVARL